MKRSAIISPLKFQHLYYTISEGKNMELTLDTKKLKREPKVNRYCEQEK
jgi:hypothetical protein